MNVEKYLLGRAESTTAWIGFIGLILEVFLHLGNTSTIMLVLFAILLVAPEDAIKEQFAKWTKNIKTRDDPKTEDKQPIKE